MSHNVRPLTVEQYLRRNYLDESFDFMELLKVLQPDPDDRAVIEQEIKDTVNDIINDPASQTALQQLGSTIAVGDFRILRSYPIMNYWNMLTLRKLSLQNAMEQNINTLNEAQSVDRRYNNRSSTRYSEGEEVHEIDGIMLIGMRRSIGSVIKTEAIRLSNSARTYDDLDNDQKNIIFLGLNSMCDLSNNSDSRESQKSLFTENAWNELKNRVYVSRDMSPLPRYIERDLLRIKEVAMNDLKRAYQISLSLQREYAFTPDEAYFQVYSHM
ncbi:hypothetical protein BDF14DRAFT_612964 [Spinellus fusiger]|nr:hypothetical protein BDF14DRAFT_612964 [Spinellus fusiger]